MKDAQKPDHLSLSTILARLKEGRFVIPDFQREFEWLPWDISDLMRSIFLDYYIGSLLLWKGKPESFEALHCEPVYGYIGSGSPEHIVLDGQQRLTAIYYALVAPDIRVPNRTNRYVYFIRVDRFMDAADDDAFTYDWTRAAQKLLDNRPLQFERHMFPLAIVGRGGFELYDWVRGYEDHWRKEAARLADSDEIAAAQASRRADESDDFGERLKGIVEQYQIAYIELERDLELAKVCDIFTQINSRGVRLDIFDLMNALLRPRHLQLKQMWREAMPRLDFLKTDRLNVYILQVMSILLQAYNSPRYLYYMLPGQQKAVRQPDGSLHKEVLIPDTSEFERRWDQAVDALADATKLLSHPQEYGAISSSYLPYVSILPVFSALQLQARQLPPAQRVDAQGKIRRWYWASAFVNRYSGSVESTAARDFNDVKEWFGDDKAEPTVLAEFRDRVGSLDLRREVRRGTSVYNAIFNLLVIRGARDWMTDNIPRYDELDDHHIVPRDWGLNQPGLSISIDTILNRTPLSADTNRNLIRDRLPNEYLPELIEANGEDRVAEILESHLISRRALSVLLRKPFTPVDFDEFLAERQVSMISAIERLQFKAPIDAAPEVRVLDTGVERVELGLRRLIVATLGGEKSRLPGHVGAKLNERLRLVNRDPAIARNRRDGLGQDIELLDLRELQDTIMTPALWPLFEPRFISKPLLETKFSQLSGLRNAIRHTRTLDPVTRKDGEAAILWFDQVLVDS